MFYSCYFMFRCHFVHVLCTIWHVAMHGLATGQIGTWWIFADKTRLEREKIAVRNALADTVKSALANHQTGSFKRADMANNRAL